MAIKKWAELKNNAFLNEKSNKRRKATVDEIKLTYENLPALLFQLGPC